MEDKKLNIQLEENDISQKSLEDNLIDNSSNLCDSSCFKAVKQLMENSDKKEEFEDFIYIVHMRDNQLMDIKDKLSDLEVKLSIYKQQILEKNKLIDILKRKIYLSDEAKINNNERTITETNKINAETIKAKDELIESLKESLKLSKDNRKLWDSNQLAMTTRIDLLLAQQATANENMIEKDNEIVRLKSKTDTNEVEIKENIKIIDEMKHEIKTANENMIERDNEIIRLKSIIDTKEVEIKENIKIIDEMKHGIKTANENMIEIDNEIIGLKSIIDTKEVEIKENIKIIDEMKHEIKTANENMIKRDNIIKELRKELEKAEICLRDLWFLRPRSFDLL
ncbi:kinesin-related protein 4-like [Drosophila sulfurigaster albostrigata]|uniref:kinesin-related protein 4-like n=1 Tax=Drosophila sulfurigaster albostrigata TaxID=89887 RepID=UPI002D21BF59|nr:kinesin-related protein 4-like [Drosophila sulfurigaster albostrigata]